MNANRSKNQGPIKRLYFICGQCGFLKFRFMLKVFIFFSLKRLMSLPYLLLSFVNIRSYFTICVSTKKPFFLTVLSQMSFILPDRITRTIDQSHDTKLQLSQMLPIRISNAMAKTKSNSRHNYKSCLTINC